MARGTDAYVGAARLGRELAREGLMVATGGGPGAMEAAHLGVYAAPFDAGMLTEALRLLEYFSNATREDGLPARRNAGVVFLPGAAGTVQEIFDNATPNYYESRGEPTPMVLVDREHWTERLSAWPLLRSLARERSMESRIALVDRIEEAPAALKRLAG